MMLLKLGSIHYCIFPQLALCDMLFFVQSDKHWHMTTSYCTDMSNCLEQTWFSFPNFNFNTVVVRICMQLCCMLFYFILIYTGIRCSIWPYQPYLCISYVTFHFLYF